MSGFRPLFGGDVAGFVPLEGTETPQGESASSFTPLFGKAAPPPPAPEPEAPVEPPPPAEAQPEAAPAPAPTPVDEDVAILKAREQGFEIGRQEGLAAAQEQVAGQVAQLEALIDELTAARREIFRKSVEDLGTAITHIAERIVGRELAVDSSGVQQLVLDVLDHVQSDDEVAIRIAPEDERQMRNAAPSVLEHLGRDATFRIELDASLTPGGAVVVTQLGSIDASVETRFVAFEESVQAWVTEELGADED